MIRSQQGGVTLLVFSDISDFIFCHYFPTIFSVFFRSALSLNILPIAHNHVSFSGKEKDVICHVSNVQIIFAVEQTRKKYAQNMGPSNGRGFRANSIFEPPSCLWLPPEHPCPVSFVVAGTPTELQTPVHKESDLTAFLIFGPFGTPPPTSTCFDSIVFRFTFSSSTLTVDYQGPSRELKERLVRRVLLRLF